MYRTLNAQTLLRNDSPNTPDYVSIMGSSNVGLRTVYLPSNVIPQDSGVEPYEQKDRTGGTNRAEPEAQQLSDCHLVGVIGFLRPIVSSTSKPSFRVLLPSALSGSLSRGSIPLGT